MIELPTIISFLGGLGVGSVITVIVKHVLEQNSKKKDIWIKEYKEACDGLLDSYREAALDSSDKSQKAFAHWEVRLQLLASEEVIDAVKRLKESDPGSKERIKAHKDMISGMRKDLGIA